MSNSNYVALAISGIGGGLVGGVFSLAGMLVEQRRTRRGAVEMWKREAGHIAMQRLLNQARQLDHLATALAVGRHLGTPVPIEARPPIDAALRGLEESLAELEIFVSPRVVVAATDVAREARATVAELYGDTFLANVIRRSQPPPMEAQRPFAVKRAELLDEIRADLGLEP